MLHSIPNDLIFSLQHYYVFLQVAASSGPGHVPFAGIQTVAAWYMVQHSLVLFSASKY